MENMGISALQNFLKLTIWNKPEDIIKILREEIRHYFTISISKGIKYFNVPCSFDIETTSFYENGEKCSIMYEWTFGIFGRVIIGRTWEEFINMIRTLSEELKLNEKKRLIIYIHNLSFEFQFLRTHFLWDKIFSIDTRKPIYAICQYGIEFRCSYLLSGYSLAKLADQLKIIKIQKMIGDLDYSLIRHNKTVLTDKEIGYCINDVKIVMAYIGEEINRLGNITRIPLTKTGYVRNFCRNSCFYDETNKKNNFKRLKYKELINGMTLTVDEYKQLKRAFQGGFTHANPFYVNKIVENVTSFDFTSSYPAVMVSEMFPMNKSELIDRPQTKTEFEKNLKYYCCLFDIEFTNLESKIFFENYISSYRCNKIQNATINNGRIVRADHLITTVTEQDYLIIKNFYTWDNMKISNFRRYKKGYLPTDFIKAILKLYCDKTMLKGVENKEIEYLNSKEMLNSTYGMTVTDIVRDIYIYDDEWRTESPDFDESIKKYNKNPQRFLYYPWGVWITAYARRNLFTGIIEFKGDYIYSDTDSIKVLNADKHMDYISKYNKWISEKLLKAMNYHELDFNNTCPKTIKGVEKPLGVWDYDGHYKRFKTLGAKRYMVEYDNNDINITVSGLNKKTCVPYLKQKYGNEIFNNFKQDMYIPPEYTGKNTHTYIDEPISGIITDYTGITADYKENSSVHIEPSEYSLSISQEFLNYILNIKEVE